MDLKGKTVILTGATGGIGRYIALQLAEAGANLALVGRNIEKLESLRSQCERRGVKAAGISADTGVEADIARIVKETESALGPVDILINNAGAMSFSSPTGYSAKDVQNVIMTNIYGPIRLAQAVLPEMLARKCGRIVNIGSIFGSLSFPYFGVYSASKCAVRGYTEALRREIQGSGVEVTYIAPRGTKTSQTPEFLEMAKKTGMNLDEPEAVGRLVVDAIRRGKKELYIGGPERLFVLINKLFPGIIDKALRKNVAVMKEYA